MLVEFRIANFRSFSGEQTFSLVASRDTSHPANVTEDSALPHAGFKLLKTAAIFGANASGKSNLVKAMGFMRHFILLSATRMNQGDSISGAVPFRLLPEQQGLPSSFEITLFHDSIRYVYGFTATPDRIHDEWLSSHPPKTKEVRWFERHFDASSGAYSWDFGKPLKDEAAILKEKTRDNGLVLSRGAELNIGGLSQLFLWFRTRLHVLDMSQYPVLLSWQSLVQLKEDKGFQERVTTMLRHADLSIDGLAFPDESARASASHSEGNQPSLFAQHVLQGPWRNAPVSVHRAAHAIHTLHRLADSDEQVEFAIDDESNGTQRFFFLALRILQALDDGRTLVVDELDCSMHPLLTRKVVELFQNSTTNTKGAQLVFVTHDSTLMDPDLLRRDQVWLVDKNQAGASELFSLYDFDTSERPRVAEAFQKNYLAGRYGGIPLFGPTLENLDQ